ncbi:hypothetical protein [Candidatus Ruminimicrobium bovinum]|uniref:hypothetical protein n=1 Tax=Candidatus Ruminimicrobium bovinum TaxID=3242779 RepID=UPI0039B95652
MIFKRDYYLNKLINNKNNSFIKVITGIRRCGKSKIHKEITVSQYLQRIKR